MQQSKFIQTSGIRLQLNKHDPEIYFAVVIVYQEMTIIQFVLLPDKILFKFNVLWRWMIRL